MTGDPGTGDPGTGDVGTGDVGTGDVGTGDVGTGGADRSAVRSSPPLTGDGQVDSVLERMRAELAELAEDDLTGRRGVLAGADVALRTLLDSGPDHRSDSDPDSTGAGSSPFPAH